MKTCVLFNVVPLGCGKCCIRDPSKVYCVQSSVITSNTHLDMIRSQNDPPTEAVAQIDDSHTAAEANDTGEGGSECHDQDLLESTR